VVGIVSRANIIQALAELPEGSEWKTTSVSMIRKNAMKQIKSGNATVQSGRVHLWGAVDSVAEKEAAGVAVELVEGAKAIDNNVMVLPVVAGSSSTV
jgi:hypothetical protein